MLDSGASDNVLSVSVFNGLPAKVRDGLITEPDLEASLADGSGLLIYGSITIMCRVRCVPAEIAFRVANISEDAILGMSFFRQYQCQLLMDKGILRMGDHELNCVDKYGGVLSTKVQIPKLTEIAANSEYQLTCRLIQQTADVTGVVEHYAENDLGIRLASTLVTANKKDQVVVRCINPHPYPVQVRAGTTVGLFSVVNGRDIFTNKEQPTVATLSSGAQVCDGSSTRPTLTGCGVVPPHLYSLYKQALPNCGNAVQVERLSKLLNTYSDVFSKDETDIGCTDLVLHEIPINTGSKPIKIPPRRLGAEKDAEVERQVQDLVRRGLIEPSESSWSAPTVLVKKRDGSWRLCIDYRQLNSITKKDAYPLPRIDDSIDALSGSTYFSTLDLVSGYWQVKMSADAAEKAAFCTRGGLWQPSRLSFGLTSAPATFERLMEKVLSGLQWKSLLLYLDDVIVFSSDFDTHLQRLEVVLQRFKGANLKLKPSKCELLQTEVRYLGHIVSKDGVKTDPDKVKAVVEWTTPKCTPEVRSFVGFVGYYRRFCPDYATVAKPLNRLTAKGVDFKWGHEEQESFEKMKMFMSQAPVLAYPDPKLPYIVDTDASLYGVGAVISQVQGGDERAIAFYSKTLSPAEQNYCTTRRELLSVILAVKHFRPYLYGREFTLRNDHASLQWLYRRKEPSHQVARWLEILSEFQFELKHRPGANHGNADGLSRGCNNCKQCQRIEQRDGGPTWEDMEMDWSVSNVQKPQPRDGTPAANTISLLDDLNRDIPTLQKRDKNISIIREAVINEKPVSKSIVDLGSAELKKLSDLQHLCKVDCGVLKLRVLYNNRETWVTVCPSNMRPLLIEKVHTQHHAGVNKTYRKLKLNWYWPGMTGDIRRLLKKCEVCQAAKHSTHKPGVGRQRLFAGRPWQVVSIDLVTPLTETSRGNKAILVLSDHFTKWRDAIPIPNGTAEVVADVLDQRVFSYFGLPERIHSDRGTNFESKLMMELCRLWNVDKSKTTSYNPKGNGTVERGNKDLGDALRTLLLSRAETDWDLLLPQIMRSIRAMPHSFTDESANFMMFGRELNLPDTLIAGPSGDLEDKSQYVQNLVKRLSEAYEFVRSKQENIIKTDDQFEPKFKTGDRVWMKADRFRKHTSVKLQPKYYGPYNIVEVFKNRTYKLEQEGKLTLVNEDKLKLHSPATVGWGVAPSKQEPVRQPPRPGRSKPQPVFIPDDVEGNPVTDTQQFPVVLADHPTTAERAVGNDHVDALPIPDSLAAQSETTPHETDNSNVKAVIKENIKAQDCAKVPNSHNTKGTGRMRRLPARFKDYDLSQVKCNEPCAISGDYDRDFPDLYLSQKAHVPTPHAYSLPGKNYQANRKWRKLNITLSSIDMSAEQAEQAPILDILEEGELLEENMDITVPSTPAGGLCDAWGHEDQENCAESSRQAESAQAADNFKIPRKRQIQVNQRGMSIQVEKPSSIIDGHPYIHRYTQKAFMKLLTTTKDERCCSECHKDMKRAPEIIRRHVWDHFVYYLCTCGFLTARQESLHSHQRRAECTGYEKIDSYNKERAARELNVQIPREWDKLIARPRPDSERHGQPQAPAPSPIRQRGKRAAPSTSTSEGEPKSRPALNQVQIQPLAQQSAAPKPKPVTPKLAAPKLATPKRNSQSTPAPGSKKRTAAPSTAPPPPSSSSSSSSEDEETLLTRSPVRRRIKEQYVAELNFNMARIEDLERLKAPLTARNAELLKLICE